MADLPEKTNLENYLEVVRKLDPELYLVKTALLESGLDPMVLIKVIRAIGNLTLGTGTGIVRVYMKEKKIRNVQTEENFFILGDGEAVLVEHKTES